MKLEFENRNEVPKELKADLTSFYKNEKEWLKDFKWVQEHIKDLEQYKNHILDNAQTLEKFLLKEEEIENCIEKLYVYAMFRKDCDVTSQSKGKMFDQIANLYAEYASKTSFVRPELLENDYSVVKRYVQENSNLNRFSFNLEKLFRYQEYTLTTKEEALLALLSPSLGAFNEIFQIMQNSDLKYGTIKVDGKNKEITSTNGKFFSTHKDRNVRKLASLKKINKTAEFANTFATNLVAHLKALDTEAKLRGFKNFQESSLYDDKVDIKLYNNLINFSKKYASVNKKWYQIVKKVLGYEELYNYDIDAPLLDDYKKEYSVNTAQSIIKNALQILGDEYVEVLQKAFDEKWIDYSIYKGKVNRWYEITAYNAHPLVYANYYGKLEDVSSLSHELGHAIHSYFAKESNTPSNWEYTIFVAEVASLTNEILVNNYIIKNTTDEKEKLECLHNLIELIVNNFFDAANQAGFEQEINNRISMGESLSKDDLNKIWSDIRYIYYDPVLKFDKLFDVTWCRIPHFFSPFYTYKYALDISCACFVASKILANEPGYKEKYINFLKAGDNDYPINQLKMLDIDLSNDNSFMPTIEMLDELMNEFVETYEEVN